MNDQSNPARYVNALQEETAVADEIAGPFPHVSQEFGSLAEVDAAVDKLQRRVSGLEQLDINPVFLRQTRADHIVAEEIRDTISDVFGPNSPEFIENRDLRIWTGPEHVGMTDAEIIAATEEGRTRAIGILEGLIKRLEKRKDELMAGTVPSTYFDRLDLHPRIREASRDPFLRGDHWEAVFAGMHALVNYVRERSNHHDLGGVQLMRVAFSKDDPLLAFNDLTDQADFDEQEGLMNLFAGVVLLIRNPEGRLVSKRSDRRAIEYICLLSLLAHRLEHAKIGSKSQAATSSD
jgi:uncharacterized protein (TIGR02391 family)